LRRVEANLVAVWVAFSEPAETVKLSIWEGQVEAGRTDAFVAGSTVSRRIGDKLYLAVVNARIPVESGKAFLADRLYSYDVEVITIADGKRHTLQSLHMLDDQATDGFAHAPLGFERNKLPCFAPPPSELADLRVLYGSCRRPGHEDPDALAWIDDLLAGEELYKNPRTRPHQLFLGGDQIYADDVDLLFMLRAMELGQELIGRTADGEPIERLPLKIFRKRNATEPKQDDPWSAYDEAADHDVADKTLPVDRAHFPEGQRLHLTQRAAQLTSTDGYSHLLSLGEFAATYVMAWSNAAWGTEVPGATLTPEAGRPDVTKPLEWTDVVARTAHIATPDLEFPPIVAEHLYLPVAELSKDERPATTEAGRADQNAERQKTLRKSHRILRELLESLPRVRRVLASIPTYMILDDHDVTDDYFLNPAWRNQVLGTPLGTSLLTNAMTAYALFQDWGNNPARYAEGSPAELLDRAGELFPSEQKRGPAHAPFERLGVLFGHDLLLENPRTDGGYDPVRPPIPWHFMIDGPRHRVVCLDNRTRRSYVGRYGPPGNVSIESQAEQIPAPPMPAGIEILLVVAPLQVIGPPVLDGLLSPLIYRATDAFHASDIVTNAPTGMRGMTGTDPDAIESWAFDAVTFENLLKRMAPYRRAVLLSGDVHNSSGNVMSYWRGTETQPARFAQFTSSGFKNVMPAKIAAVDRSAGFAQQMIRSGLGTERIGWERPLDDLVLLPTGKSQLDLIPVMRARLQSVPVMIPPWGWPDENPKGGADPLKTSRLNPVRPPDWRWRITPLIDQRTNLERPKPIQTLELDNDAIDGDLADNHTAIRAYQRIAARHQHALDHLRGARQILFHSNFGLCRFEPQEDGTLHAIHDIYTAVADPDDPTASRPKPEVYLRQVAELGPADEEPPTRLRARVIP
jgi:hypothetical protein